MKVNGCRTKLWWKTTNGDVDETVTNSGRRQTVDDNGWWMAMDGGWQRTVADGNGWQRTIITTNGDDDSTVEQFAFLSCAAMAYKRKKRFFFLIILFFASSTNLVACSFDHSCRKLVEMEIKKWSLKKSKKPNAYRSGVLLTNLHEELKQQRS
jgi:hypothetical protein